MYRDDERARKGSPAADKDFLPLKILLHCRTVVEKSQFVTTGVMTQVEGELFEIELGEFAQFELGEKVKLTVYSPAGIQTIQSLVFAKYEGAIAVIQPPSLNQRFQEKREFYRVAVDGTVSITSTAADKDLLRPLADPMDARLCDISLGGVGFRMEEGQVPTDTSRLGVILRMGFEYPCELEIVRRERREDAVVYGTRITATDEAMHRNFRAFLLRRQVEIQMENRKLAVKKRS